MQKLALGLCPGVPQERFWHSEQRQELSPACRLRHCCESIWFYASGLGPRSAAVSGAWGCSRLRAPREGRWLLDNTQGRSSASGEREAKPRHGLEQAFRLLLASGQLGGGPEAALRRLWGARCRNGNPEGPAAAAVRRWVVPPRHG